jgi:hypothetical protein
MKERVEDLVRESDTEEITAFSDACFRVMGRALKV